LARADSNVNSLYLTIIHQAERESEKATKDDNCLNIDCRHCPNKIKVLRRTQKSHIPCPTIARVPGHDKQQNSGRTATETRAGSHYISGKLQYIQNHKCQNTDVRLGVCQHLIMPELKNVKIKNVRFQEYQ
jgi:hypothetical protein